MKGEKENKLEICCPYCETEIAEAELPFCKPCKVSRLKCPECGQKVSRTEAKCSSCGATLKTAAV